MEIQDEALDGQLVAVVDGGAGAHVGHGQVGVAVFQDDLGGIDALGGGEDVLFQLQVHRGEAQGGAQLLAVGHPVAEGVGMAQKFVGAFDLPLGDQGADIGGGDGDTVLLYAGDDVAADAQLLAGLFQQLGVALAPYSRSDSRGRPPDGWPPDP